MGKIKKLLEKCEYGCVDQCGHEKCGLCNDTYHSCAGCDGDYCECTESLWALGKNGITYCSQECAGKYGGKVPESSALINP
jgi:hypothetical protein